MTRRGNEENVMKSARAARGGAIALGLALAAAIAALAFVFWPTSSAAPARTPDRATLVPAPAPAPPGWHQLTLPNGTAVLFYPPAMHRVHSDGDAVSAARLGPDGQYLLYLNATPQQGDESLRNWASFRLLLLRSDTASRASLDAAAEKLPFRGGTGSCVIDHYVTRVLAHRYTELACLVQGQSGASVIVAAALTALWPSARAVLAQAVSAYTVR
jgi:hypothetical protein